ncbi:uncharacterized protein PAC_15258 [Phialocephala subalpina]|uniref:Uncharacterized protein n=1 Tax=Phialocephala subalpina TaxID=576137 RepID=A0A1L7XK18_9HELO|nr:uncharacterized protein PAC_15258 [Phialocephala subalpina]
MNMVTCLSDPLFQLGYNSNNKCLIRGVLQASSSDTDFVRNLGLTVLFEPEEAKAIADICSRTAGSPEDHPDEAQNVSSTSLPAGWDRDRVYSTNEIERATLPDANQELILAWRKADAELSTARLRATVAAHTDLVNASRVAAGLPTIEEAERSQRRWVLRILIWPHKVEVDGFGGYGGLREVLTGKLLWWLVNHETMDRKAFKEESVDSLLDREETATALLALEKEKAFVWGVDVNYDDNDDKEGNEYSGHFKISINYIPAKDKSTKELWEILQRQSPDELYSGGGEIYERTMR